MLMSIFATWWNAADVPIVVVGDMNALETESSMLAATRVMQDTLLVSKTTPAGRRNANE